MELGKALRMCRQSDVFCCDVTFSQFIILDAVSRKGTLIMTGLGEILSVDKSTVTRLIAPLVKRNLIVLEKGDRDSRQVILRIPEKGMKKYLELMQAGVPVLLKIYSGRTPERWERWEHGRRPSLS